MISHLEAKTEYKEEETENLGWGEPTLERHLTDTPETPLETEPSPRYSQYEDGWPECRVGAALLGTAGRTAGPRIRLGSIETIPVTSYRASYSTSRAVSPAPSGGSSGSMCQEVRTEGDREVIRMTRHQARALPITRGGSGGKRQRCMSGREWRSSAGPHTFTTATRGPRSCSGILFHVPCLCRPLHWGWGEEEGRGRKALP